MEGFNNEEPIAPEESEKEKDQEPGKIKKILQKAALGAALTGAIFGTAKVAQKMAEESIKNDSTPEGKHHVETTEWLRHATGESVFFETNGEYSVTIYSDNFNKYYLTEDKVIELKTFQKANDWQGAKLQTEAVEWIKKNGRNTGTDLSHPGNPLNPTSPLSSLRKR